MPKCSQWAHKWKGVLIVSMMQRWGFWWQKCPWWWGGWWPQWWRWCCPRWWWCRSKSSQPGVPGGRTGLWHLSLGGGFARWQLWHSVRLFGQCLLLPQSYWLVVCILKTERICASTFWGVWHCEMEKRNEVWPMQFGGIPLEFTLGESTCRVVSKSDTV